MKGLYTDIEDLSRKSPYLVPNQELRGTTPPYVKTLTFLDASKAVDPTDLAGAGIQLAAIPSPIVDKYIRLPSGSLTNPALSWSADAGDGLYRVGADDYAYAVNGSNVTEWLAAEFRVNYLTQGSILFAGPSGKVSQDNANFFWDDTNNRQGIGTITPNYKLDIWSATTQLGLSNASGDSTVFWATTSNLLVISDTATQMEYQSLEGSGQIRYLSVYQSRNAGAFTADAQLYAHVVGASSGDPMVQLGIDGVRAFALGIDNSDSDKFKISYSASSTAALGTNDRFTIYTTGDIAFGTGSFYWDNTNSRLTVNNAFIYTPATDILFIGNSCGTLTASGTTTVGIGHNVMPSITTGQGLTGVGDAAFNAVTSGYQSTAVGASALLSMIDGHHNSAFGVQALKSLTSGTQNTAIGIDSLEWITTQSGNTALGYQAGQDAGGTLTNFTNCTFLGTSATASANGLTNAMAIGYAAQVGSSNVCVIGNSSLTNVNPGVSGVSLGSSSVPWVIKLAAGSASAPSLNFVQNSGDGIYGYTGGVVAYTIGGTGQMLMTTNEIRVASGVAINWGSSTFDSTGDIGISRITTRTLGITDASHAMSLRIYGSGSIYTSLIHNGTNGVLDVSSGLLVLGGTATIVASAAILCGTDGGFDLGGGSNRFANEYLAGYIQFTEMTAPSGGSANTARLFSRDNGAGKTQLCVIFNTGAVQVIATEP